VEGSGGSLLASAEVKRIATNGISVARLTFNAEAEIIIHIKWLAVLLESLMLFNLLRTVSV
jgi:hypothetical protein